MTDNEWGNLELPGFGDDKLLDPNLNRKLAAQEVTKRADWKLNNLQAITKPDVVKRKSEATKQQWLNGRTEAVKHISESITNKWEDPEYIKRQQIGRAKSGQYTDPTKTANYKGAHVGTCVKTGVETVYVTPQDLLDAGISPSNVYNCINGKRKTTGGKTWRRQ